MTVIYQSRFLRFCRVQILRWQQQWQVKHRRWQTSLIWTLQAWAYPVYRLVQVNQWLPRGLKQTFKQQWSRLQAQTDALPPPPSDTALVNLMQSLEIEGLTVNSPESSAPPTIRLLPPNPPAQSFPTQAWAQILSLATSSWARLQRLLQPGQTAPLPPTQDSPKSLVAQEVAPELLTSAEDFIDKDFSLHRPTLPLRNWILNIWPWGRHLAAQTLTPASQPLHLPASSGPSALSTQSASRELTPPPHGDSESTSLRLNHSWAWLSRFVQTARDHWQQRKNVLNPFQNLTAITLAQSQATVMVTSESTGILTTAADLKVQTYQIQSLACQLDNHHLVLVTPEQEVLDILTPAQQQHLRERILWELAGYYFQLRQWQRLTGQCVARFGLDISVSQSLPISDPPQISSAFALKLPLRQFWQQFQAWVFGGLTIPPVASLATPNSSLTVGSLPNSLRINTSPTSTLGHPPQTMAPVLSISSPLGAPFTIDIASTVLGYEPRGWEVLWLWLDRLFVWLERAWAWLAGKWTKQVPSS